MDRFALACIALLFAFVPGQSQNIPAPHNYVDSPEWLNSESGDQPYIAWNSTRGDGPVFARLFSNNATGVAAQAVIYVQEFDAHLKARYTRVAPNVDTVLVGNPKLTRIFYLGGTLHFCYYRLDGSDQFFYIFKSSFDRDSLTLHLAHVEQIQGSLFDDEQFFNKTGLGYDYSYDFARSPDGQLVMLALIGSRRTGEKSTLLVRTFRSNFESLWQKRLDLPASPNVLMLKNAMQQTIESFKQDYSFRPYVVNQVMNGLPQLTGAVLDDGSNAFVRIDETTEAKKAFGVRTRVPTPRRDWYSFYDVGSKVIVQNDAGDQVTLEATIAHDSLTLFSCVPRQENARIPSFRVPVRALLPAANDSKEYVVSAVSRDSARNSYIVIMRRLEKDERADGFQVLKLAPQGAILMQKFIATKNLHEILATSLVDDQFTVYYSAMPKAQVVTGFNAMLREFSSSLLTTTMDGSGNVTTAEIKKMAGEGPNVVFREGPTALMAWYSHEDKKLVRYSLLTTVDR